MDEQFIRNRLTKLRQQKQVSERKMSLDLGHSTSYIRSITSGRALPSMSEFLYICEYLGVTPQEFFDEGNPNPAALKEFITEAKKLDSKTMSYILGIMKELNSKNRSGQSHKREAGHFLFFARNKTV